MPTAGSYRERGGAEMFGLRRKGNEQLTGQATSKTKPSSRPEIPSQPRKSTSAHQKAPPMKEEIPKQAPPRRRSSNLIAKLMGLDPLPAPKPNKGLDPLSASEKSREFRDVYEVREVKHTEKNSRAIQRDEDVVLIERAFLEAKRLSTNEDLRKSQKFDETLDILDSRKDLLLKFLEEPNSRFKTLLEDLKPPQPASESRITILRSSSFSSATWQKTIDQSVGFDPLPSRIVVLKPSIHRVDREAAESSEASEDIPHISKRSREIRRSGRREALYELGDNEMTHRTKQSGEIAKQVTRHMRQTITNRDAKRRLSERWTMAQKERDSLSSAGCSTLGEMLNFSDVDIPDVHVPVCIPLPSSPSPERVITDDTSVLDSSAVSGILDSSSRSFSSSSAIEKYCTVDAAPESHEKEIAAITEEEDQPSPISVLEPPTESFERLGADLRELRLKLQLLKLESSGNEDDCTGAEQDQDQDQDQYQYQEQEAEADFTYLVEVLAEAGFRRNDWDELFCRFFAPEAPICPGVFHDLEKAHDDSSWRKSDRKLLFDMFNGVLADLLTMNMELRPWVKQNNRLICGRRDLLEEAWELLCKRRREAVNSGHAAFLEDPMWFDLVEDVDSAGRDVERILMDDLLRDLVSDFIHL